MQKKSTNYLQISFSFNFIFSLCFIFLFYNNAIANSNIMFWGDCYFRTLAECNIGDTNPEGEKRERVISLAESEIGLQNTLNPYMQIRLALRIRDRHQELNSLRLNLMQAIMDFSKITLTLGKMEVRVGNKGCMINSSIENYYWKRGLIAHSWGWGGQLDYKNKNFFTTINIAAEGERENTSGVIGIGYKNHNKRLQLTGMYETHHYIYDAIAYAIGLENEYQKECSLRFYNVMSYHHYPKDASSQIPYRFQIHLYQEMLIQLNNNIYNRFSILALAEHQEKTVWHKIYTMELDYCFIRKQPSFAIEAHYEYHSQEKAIYRENRYKLNLTIASSSISQGIEPAPIIDYLSQAKSNSKNYYLKFNIFGCYSQCYLYGENTSNYYTIGLNGRVAFY